MADALSGIDYSQYPNWERITAPTGAVYYKVPGTGYVYDPFLSQQKKRPVLWTNPQPAVDEKKKAEKQIEEQGSLQNQLLPVVAGTAGTVGGAYAINQLTKDSPTPGSSAAPTTSSAKDTFVNSATPPGTSTTAATTGAAGGTGSITALGPAAMPDGSAGVQMSDGSVVSTGSGGVVTPDGTQVINNQAVAPDGSIMTGANAMKALGYAAAVYGAYNTYQNRKNLSTEQEAAGYAQAATAAASASGLLPAGYGAALSGALNVYGTYTNDDMTAEDQASRAQQQIGLAAADAFTFGLSSIGHGLMQNTSFGQKLDRELTELDQKINPITWGLTALGSGKSEEQMGRDKVREHLEKLGVINQEGEDKDWMLKFSDGTQFDIGKDGGARLVNEEGERRQYSDVDFSDARVGTVVGAVNPLAAILTGGNEKLRSDFAGEYTNAVLSGSEDPASINKRLQELYSKHNLTQSDAITQIDSLLEDEKIDAQTAAAYKNGVNTVFSGNAYAAPQAAAPGAQPDPAGPVPMQIQKPLGNVGTQTAQIMGANIPIKQPVAGQVDPQFNAQRGAGVPINANPQQAAYVQVPVDTRTTTRSPGIGLDGKPINYAKELARRADERNARR